VPDGSSSSINGMPSFSGHGSLAMLTGTGAEGAVSVPPLLAVGIWPDALGAEMSRD
jgi:hypothetical protein